MPYSRRPLVWCFLNTPNINRLLISLTVFPGYLVHLWTGSCMCEYRSWVLDMGYIYCVTAFNIRSYTHVRAQPARARAYINIHISLYANIKL